MGEQPSPGAYDRRMTYFNALLSFSLPVLLLLLMILLGFGGCSGKTPSATSEASDTPKVTQIAVVKPQTVAPDGDVHDVVSRPPEPTPTSLAGEAYTRTIWFVWDRTASMDTFCMNSKHVLQRLPAFLAKLGYWGEQEKVHAGVKANLYVGILQMTGAGHGICTEVMPPTLVDTVVVSPALREKLLDPAMDRQTKACDEASSKIDMKSDCHPDCKQEKENGYATALEHIENWKEKNVRLDSRNTATVVLFTDGTHIFKNCGPECEETRTPEFLGRLKGNGLGEDGIDTSVVLCNDVSGEDKKNAVDFWRRNTKDEADVSELLAVPGELIAMTQDVLGDFMPKQGKWIDGRNPYTFTVPGDALKITANVVGLPVESGSPKFSLSGPVVGFATRKPPISHSLEEWPNRYRIDEIVDGPVDTCAPLMFTVEANEGIGYAWRTFVRPPVFFTAESSFSSTNYAPVPITFSLRSRAMSYRQLMNRRDCYRVRLGKGIGGTRPQKDRKIKALEDGKFVEAHGQLESHWVWMPGDGKDRSVSATKRISVPVELDMATQKTPLALMDVPLTRTLMLQLKGNAIKVETMPTPACPRGGDASIPNYEYVWKLDFEDVVFPSDVHVDVDVGAGGGKKVSCTATNGDYSCNVNTLGNITPDTVQEETSSELPVILRVSPEKNSVVTYTLIFSSYVYNVCQVKTITFTWKATGVTWVCKLSENGNASKCNQTGGKAP